MDQFEETVVNPNISLNNFEVKIRDDDHNDVQKETIANTIPAKKTSKNYRAFLLLVILSLILIYQVTAFL